MNRLLSISILGEPSVARREAFDGLEDGQTDWDWIASRLRERGLEGSIEISGVDVSLGETLPSPDAFDGVVVGGSIHNVNEGRDWQRRTIEWLADWRETGRPLFGICGGHQMAAVALGGTVERMNGKPISETGGLELTEEGRKHYLFDSLGHRPEVHFGHFDHVSRVPDGSSVLAMYKGFIATLDLGGNWCSTQFHPESTGNGMVVAWDGALAPETLCYRESPDGGRIIENFLRGTGLI